MVCQPGLACCCAGDAEGCGYDRSGKYLGGAKRGASGQNRELSRMLCQPIWAEGFPVVARDFSILTAQPQFWSQNVFSILPRYCPESALAFDSDESEPAAELHSKDPVEASTVTHFPAQCQRSISIVWQSTAKFASTLSTATITVSQQISILKYGRYRTSFAYCRLFVPTCTAGTYFGGADRCLGTIKDSFCGEIFSTAIVLVPGVYFGFDPLHVF